nr:MAG TPA: hypothetical protein [Caudoviricetes sp.]
MTSRRGYDIIIMSGGERNPEDKKQGGDQTPILERSLL